MSDVLQNLAICHRCIYRQKPGTVCTKTGEAFSAHADDGDCPEGFFNGQRLPLHRVVQGAVGKVKAAAGMDAASPDVIEQRRNVCLACPGGHAVVKDGALVSCNVCKCQLWAKLTLASEACPQSYWPAVQAREGAD